MGILNVTPDSFSDGGLFVAPGKAVDQARKLIEDGADILDVGGESTRPGAAAVTADQELDRVIPVIEAIARRFPTPVSIDTSKAAVISAAVAAGATMINDVRALQEPGALDAAMQAGVPVCLMHMRGEPRTMQQAPAYRDVVTEVQAFLQQRVQACLVAGMPSELLCTDPGFGFGKTREHNFRLLRELEATRVNSLPILVGLSRKSMIGQALGLPVEDRVAASIALALLAVANGANIVRVHDVRETWQALSMREAVLNERGNA